MSRQISRSRLRFLGLESDVETKLRYLDCRDQLFVDVKTNRDPHAYIYAIQIF